MKKKRNILRVALWISGFLLVLAVGMLLGAFLERTNDLFNDESKSMMYEEEPIYTQSQMNAQMNSIQTEMDEAIQASVEEQLSEAVEAAQEEGRNTVLEYLRDMFLDGKTAIEILRPLYKNEVVLVSDGDYYFVPIREDLKKNSWSQEQVKVLESGEKQYIENDTVISHKGIDVSQFQGAINWEKVAQDGVEFTFIRAFFRGYGSGKIVDDEYFDTNIAGALANNIHTGVYFFTQAITKEEAIEEAEKVIEMTKPYASGIPIAIDVERVAGKSPRMDKISVQERTEIVALMCERIAAAGYIPYIYHNTEMGILFLDLSQLEPYKKWFASYAKDMFYPYEYGIWQYSDKGSVAGIKDEVDLNISFSEFWKE